LKVRKVSGVRARVEEKRGEGQGRGKDEGLEGAQDDGIGLESNEVRKGRVWGV